MVATERDARKEPAGPGDLKQLFAGRKRLLVGKGKKHTAHDLRKLPADELAALVIGPTGNLRAPTLLVGDAVVVGFTPEMYAEVLG